MKLSLYEQETIILYNQAEATAEVYSHDPRLLEKLRRLAEKYPDQMTGLSEREREVAALAAEGLRNKEIAQRLFISEETVKSQIRSIFNKTNIDRRSKLVDLLK